MTSLEIQYRRLLGIYPAAHRAAYEREMLGVLMAGSRPGQRFPALADTFDVLRNGLFARFSSTGRTERGRGWRDAAGVVALLSAVALMIIAVRRAVWSVAPPIRRRILALAAVGAVLPLTQQFLLTLLDARYTRSVTPVLLATELIFMIVAPAGTLALALLAPRRREAKGVA